MNKQDPILSYVKPEEKSGYLLWQVTMQWQLKLNRKLIGIDLTLTQFSLLAGLYWLSRQQEIVTQQRLATYANTDKMMTSKILITLERKELITREMHPDDNRARQPIITEKGILKLKVANDLVQAEDSLFFKPVENNKDVFDDLLKKLIK